LSTNTFGPAYDPTIDRKRVGHQMEWVLTVMLRATTWLSLGEIEYITHYPQASISAQLRHLRKKKFGGYVVEKRRRPKLNGTMGGTWEYNVRPPCDEEGQSLLGF